MPLVELRGIRKAYGSIDALRGVDLDLHAGECLGLVGDNAAGKSTLTKVLAGTVIPDAGEIRLGGSPIAFDGPGPARRLGIEMVYQDLALCDSVDVAGNLFLGREITRHGLLDEDAPLAVPLHDDCVAAEVVDGFEDSDDDVAVRYIVPAPDGELALLAEFSVRTGAGVSAGGHGRVPTDPELSRRIEALMSSFRWAA